MKAAIQITYVVELADDDVENIQRDAMTIDDIDVDYYINRGEFEERMVDYICEE